MPQLLSAWPHPPCTSWWPLTATGLHRRVLPHRLDAGTHCFLAWHWRFSARRHCDMDRRTEILSLLAGTTFSSCRRTRLQCKCRRRRCRHQHWDTCASSDVTSSGRLPWNLKSRYTCTPCFQVTSWVFHAYVCSSHGGRPASTALRGVRLRPDGARRLQRAAYRSLGRVLRCYAAFPGNRPFFLWTRSVNGDSEIFFPILFFFFHYFLSFVLIFLAGMHNTCKGDLPWLSSKWKLIGTVFKSFRFCFGTFRIWQKQVTKSKSQLRQWRNTKQQHLINQDELLLASYSQY